MTPPPLSDGVPKAYVYLLRSLKDNKSYLGWTTDLERRLDAHNDGLVESTSSRRPFELVYFESFSSSDEAKLRERKLKRNPNMLKYFKKRALNSASSPIGVKEVVG